MKIISLCVLLLLAADLHAQDVSYLTREAEQFEKEKKDDEALKKYQEALQVSPSDERSLFKCSELSSIIGSRQTDKKLKADYFSAARTYAETVVKQYPNSADANYAMALALDKSFTGTKERLQKTGDILTFLDSALKIKPDHARSLYMMGKWNVEISGMNVAEKGALKTFFGGLPSASLPTAIDYFEKARKADPNYLLNYLDLAKAYKKNGQSDKAIEILNRLIKLPPRTADDNGYKAEGKILLESLL
jgi:tetratricopeptide (TPR) repeat protein